MPAYQALTSAFACLVVTDSNGVITETAPMLKKFTGQPLRHLTTWMERTFPWWDCKPLETRGMKR